VREITGKKVTILGLGRSGLATARYLVALGCVVTASESNATIDPDKLSELASLGVKVEFGGHSDDAVKSADLIVVSPGIKPNSEVVLKAKKFRKEVISDLELVSRISDIPMIVVTGTNGKSTTTALISHMLTSAGKKAPACGNFGVPIFSVLADKPDLLVVEASSYQLYYSPTLSPLVGVWLNLTPDHLDWHGSMEKYISAKQSMFKRQRADQYAVINHDDAIVAGTKYSGKVFPFSLKHIMLDFKDIASIGEKGLLSYRFNNHEHELVAPSELKIIGKHNIDNALAAIAACAIVHLKPEQMKEGLRTFNALEHRLEFVDTIDGISFYNDSKATNPESSIVALGSFPLTRVVLIAGGRDKGTELAQFVYAIKQYASNVVLIGEAAERFREALAAAGFKNIHQAKSLEDAVDIGAKLNAGPVVLSPACASFDMFKDYEDRGRVFKDIVRARLKKLAASH
jgi:UDP-N-acetylmuramoylalanine--D-glutamate ligase